MNIERRYLPNMPDESGPSNAEIGINPLEAATKHGVDLRRSRYQPRAAGERPPESHFKAGEKEASALMAAIASEAIRKNKTNETAHLEGDREHLMEVLENPDAPKLEPIKGPILNMAEYNRRIIELRTQGREDEARKVEDELFSFYPKPVNLTEQMLAAGRSAEEITSPKPSFAHRAEINEAIKSGYFHGMPINKVSSVSNGIRKIEVLDEDGNPLTFLEAMPAIKEAFNIYSIPDPELHEIRTPDQVREWLNRTLRLYGESNPNRPMDESLLSMMIGTINQIRPYVNPNDPRDPRNEITDYLNEDGTLTTRIVPGSNPERRETVKEELIKRVYARFTLHNLSISAKQSLKEYGQAFSSFIFAREYSMEALKDRGVKEALELFQQGITLTPADRGLTPDPTLPPDDDVNKTIFDGQEGAFFRLGAVEGEYARRKYREELRGRGLTELEADVAVDLAEKYYHILGESGYYDAPKIGKDIKFQMTVKYPKWDKDGKPIKDKNGNDEFEEEVHSVEFQKGQFLLAPEWLFKYGTTDEARLRKAMKNNNNNSVIRDRITQFYADFFANHFDAIDAGDFYKPNCLGGLGASPFKNTFYNPIIFQQNGVEFGGKAEAIKPYTYMWVTSAVKSVGCKNIVELFDYDSKSKSAPQFDILHSKNKAVRSWISGTTDASQNKDKLKAILDTPLVEPNQILTDASGEGAQNALSLFKKVTDEVYTYMGDHDDGNKKAKAHLLKGVLKFATSNEAKKYPWNYRGLSHKAIHDIILYAAASGVIPISYVKTMKQVLGNSTSMAALESATPDLIDAIWSLTKHTFGTALPTKA